MAIKRPKTTASVFTRPNRLLWLRMENNAVTIFTPPPQGNWPTGSVLLMLQSMKNTSKTYTINLSDMTVEELAAFRQAVILALDLAEPISCENDRLTKEGILDDGNPGLRFYRHAPTVVFGKGALERHDSSLYRGYEEFLSRNGADIPVTGGIPSGSSEVADLEADDPGTQDITPSLNLRKGDGEGDGVW